MFKQPQVAVLARRSASNAAIKVHLLFCPNMVGLSLLLSCYCYSLFPSYCLAAFFVSFLSTGEQGGEPSQQSISYHIRSTMWFGVSSQTYAYVPLYGPDVATPFHESAVNVTVVL